MRHNVFSSDLDRNISEYIKRSTTLPLGTDATKTITVEQVDTFTVTDGVTVLEQVLIHHLFTCLKQCDQTIFIEKLYKFNDNKRLY